MDEDDSSDATPDMAETQRQYTRQETSNLIRPEDAGAVERFIALAAKTIDHLPRPEIFKMQTKSAFSGVVQMRYWHNVPDEILRGWSDWEVEYEALLERNPRLDLAEMLGWISEVVDSSSWPDGYETNLRDWVDRGARLPWPRMLGPWAEDEIDDAFYDRLRLLRDVTGGWVHYDHVLARRVFETDEEHEMHEAQARVGQVDDPGADYSPFDIGPSGELRPADPVGTALVTVRIATGEIDERGAADEITRAVLDDPDATPEQRRAAWSLRRERGLDDLGEVVGLWDHLHAWGEGRISYREAMAGCGIETLEDLLAAALNSDEPFRGMSREEGAVAFVERIGREHLSHEDRMVANMILIRRGIA